MKILERDVMRAVAQAIRHFGLDVQRRNTGGMRNPRGRYVAFGAKGDPDWSGMLPDGRHFGLEVKRPGKRPTREQYARLRRINDQGGIGLWIDDASVLYRALPRVLAGWRVEIDDDGTVYLTDEPKDRG